VSEIEREDVVAIMSSLPRAQWKLDRILAGLGRTMDRKKKLTAEFWRQDAEMKRQLEERIAYHTAKLAEERGAEKKKQD